MPKTIAVFAISLLTVGYAPAAAIGQPADRPKQATAAADTPSMKLMTFNIRYGTARDGDNSWDKRRQLVFDLIKRHDPDILGLQEAMRFQIDQIREAVSGYEETGVGRRDGKKGGEYAVILYKTSKFERSRDGTFWFSDSPNKPGSVGWGADIPRICTWARLVDRDTHQPIHVYNVHFDHRSTESREKSAAMLIEHVEKVPPAERLVVMGDFNAGEKSLPIETIRNRGALRDSFRQRHPSATDVGTFNGFTGRSGGEKIDYIFVRARERILSARILHDHAGDRYPSDHFPVLAAIPR